MFVLFLSLFGEAITSFDTRSESLTSQAKKNHSRFQIPTVGIFGDKLLDILQLFSIVNRRQVKLCNKINLNYAMMMNVWAQISRGIVDLSTPLIRS